MEDGVMAGITTAEVDHIVTVTVLEIGDLSPAIMAYACREFELAPIAARNTGNRRLWYGLRYFSYGKGCVGRVHQALKDKSVQLLMGMVEEVTKGAGPSREDLEAITNANSPTGKALAKYLNSITPKGEGHGPIDATEE